MAQEAEVSGWLHLLFYCVNVATGSYNIAPGSQSQLRFVLIKRNLCIFSASASTMEGCMPSTDVTICQS